MAKQIPELDIIATPTAGQESLIETVVARHDTYATSRMTLAQIFTLGSISGAIKSALDTLSGLIAGNTTSINTLSSTKLNIAWGTRTGLTAKAVVATDASGNEVLITGTLWQQIGFDVSNTPVAITPTVDVHGLTQKTTPVGADEAFISDSEASWINKKVLLKDMVMISEQTAQSAFTGDSDLFVVKQASGGLRKMTVADTRRWLINGSFNYTNANLIIDPSSWSTNVWQDTSSYATGSNWGWMITALFRHHTNWWSYVSGRVQISDDNSNWTTVWTEQWAENTYYPDYRTVSLIFKAWYVRIWVARDFGYAGGSRIWARAVINLTK